MPDVNMACNIPHAYLYVYDLAVATVQESYLLICENRFFIQKDKNEFNECPSPL